MAVSLPVRVPGHLGLDARHRELDLGGDWCPRAVAGLPELCSSSDDTWDGLTLSCLAFVIGPCLVPQGRSVLG